MTTPNELFDIPVSSKYINNWGVKEALKEIKANAEDKVGVEGAYGWSYNKAEQRIEIWNQSSEKLTPSTLVLGNSSKTTEDGTIGQFGEGYKLALIVLLREGKEVAISNHDKVWIPSFRMSEIFSTETLHIEMMDNERLSSNEIRFVINGISQEEVDSFESILLETHLSGLEKVYEVEGKYTVYGIPAEMRDREADLYKEKKATPKENSTDDIDDELKEIRKTVLKVNGIFVGGIYVKASDSTYTIDYHPSQVTLSRDRDSINSAKTSIGEILTKTYSKTWRTLQEEDIKNMYDTSFVDKLDAHEKEELKVDILEALGLSAGTISITTLDKQQIRTEAKKLGIDIPASVLTLDRGHKSILLKLGVQLLNYKHPLLTKTVTQIAQAFIDKYERILTDEMRGELETIRLIAEDTYRDW